MSVKEYLSSGGEVDARDPSSGSTPLFFACGYGQLEVVKLLVEHGANLLSRNGLQRGASEGDHSSTNNKKRKHNAANQTPLHQAARFGHIDVVNYLLERGADGRLLDAELNTPFALAAMYGHEVVVRILLTRCKQRGGNNVVRVGEDHEDEEEEEKEKEHEKNDDKEEHEVENSQYDDERQWNELKQVEAEESLEKDDGRWLVQLFDTAGCTPLHRCAQFQTQKVNII